MSAAPSASPALGSTPLLPVASPATLLAQKIGLAGFSNMFASTFTNPMDLVKVRQQLQNAHNPTSSSTTFWGKVLVRMVREEGILSIYKGLGPSLMREASYSGLRMGAYDGFKGLILGVVPAKAGEKDGFGVKLGAGLMSGMLGAGVANPADVLKIRMQAYGASGSIASHAKVVYAARGIPGFYRALSPTVLRAGVLTAAQLGVYDQAKHTMIDDFPTVFQEGFRTHLAASGVAGFCCSAVSAPVDTIKVRMMADVTHQFSGALHCTAVLLKHEGPMALYSGATMCFLRLWPHSVLSLLVFEYVRKMAGLNPI